MLIAWYLHYISLGVLYWKLTLWSYLFKIWEWWERYLLWNQKLFHREFALKLQSSSSFHSANQSTRTYAQGGLLHKQLVMDFCDRRGEHARLHAYPNLKTKSGSGNCATDPGNCYCHYLLISLSKVLIWRLPHAEAPPSAVAAPWGGARRRLRRLWRLWRFVAVPRCPLAAPSPPAPLGGCCPAHSRAPSSAPATGPRRSTFDLCCFPSRFLPAKLSDFLPRSQASVAWCQGHWPQV